MKNYLDHEDKVRYVDGLLSHSQDWQWFIDLIQDTYDLDMISPTESWSDYKNRAYIWRDIFKHFVKILEVCTKTLKFSHQTLGEIYEIAKYYQGIISREDCCEKLTTSQAKAFFFCIWITKLENCTETTQYIYDTRIMSVGNYYQLIDIAPFAEMENELLQYAGGLNFRDTQMYLECLKNNIHGNAVKCSEDFWEKYDASLYHYDAFSYRNLDTNPVATWQENYLLDMVKTSVDQQTKKLKPAYIFGGESNPETAIWTSELIAGMKGFFMNPHADFILNTVDYLQNDVPLDEETIMAHVKLLQHAMVNEEKMEEILTSSSYYVISFLFKQHRLKECQKYEEYKSLFRLLGDIKDVQYIIRLGEDGYPLNSNQQKIRKDFIRDEFKKIECVKVRYELLEYLRNQRICAKIDAEHLEMVKEKFYSMIEGESDVTIPSLFYRYMLFLMDVSQRNEGVNKRWIQAEMIQLQHIWQNTHYVRQSESMQTLSHEQQVSADIVSKENNIWLVNPIVFAKECIPCTDQDIVSVMEDASKHALSHMVTHVILAPIFPYRDNGIATERHEIDKLTLGKINSLIEKNGYRFLNVLEPEVYLSAIHQHIQLATEFCISFFCKEKELYHVLYSENRDILMPPTESLTLGVVTQLFPLLEIKIRELVEWFGIFPFKNNKDTFMQYNDPSSLLRTLLMMIYDEQDSLENVPDLLFVYHVMYNSNSFNVRNECVHGRSYLSGSRLLFAFKTTLLAIHMISFRIKTIQENISDIYTPN